jgi:dolichol-phosphate mannosyltransferase
MPVNPAVVILPTYNELENLPVILNNIVINVPNVDVLIVDDGSPDGTGELADKWAEEYPQVHVLHHGPKQGLGVAYIDAFAWALDQGYETLIEMDADGSHPYQALPRMLELAGQYDLVLGSRWIPGGNVDNWTWSREMMSRGGNAYTRFMLRLPVHDASGGFRAYNRRIFDEVSLAEIASRGYCFQIDLVIRVLQAGFNVVEFPIEFVDRVRGQSKMNTAIAVESLLRITEWGFTRRKRYSGKAAVLAS